MNVSTNERNLLDKLSGAAVLNGCRTMGRGIEAQNADGIGVRSMALDVMTGNLGRADVALKFTSVPDAPPKDLS